MFLQEPPPGEQQGTPDPEKAQQRKRPADQAKSPVAEQRSHSPPEEAWSEPAPLVQ